MTNLVLTPPADTLPAHDLDAFFGAVRGGNPFTDNRVNGPSVHDLDVTAIHQPAFLRLTELAREAFQTRRGLGAVLWGEAGIGKSHLLSRLARWADDHAQLVYLHNLQAAPERLPRSLLRTVLSVLTLGRKRRLARTPLFQLAHAGVVESVGGRPGFLSWSRLERAFAAWIDRRGDELFGPDLIDRTVYEVLYGFYRSAYRAARGKEDGRAAELAVRWLSGQALDETEARELGLPPGRPRGEPVALADNQQVKQVLVALTRLAAARGRPFVLAFDQVDNLDEDQVAALARFLEALIDSSPNLLVVTAGIQASLLGWHERRVVQDSAWDRLAQFEVGLHRLTAAEALEMVRLRLRDFLTPFAALEPVRLHVQEDALFPLGEAWHRQCLADKVDVRPRDVLNGARESWRQQQERLRQLGGPTWLAPTANASPVDPGPAPPPPTPDGLRDAVDRAVAEQLTCHQLACQQAPHQLPADSEYLTGLLGSLLDQCRQAPGLGLLEVERLAARAGARPAYDLALIHRGGAAVPFLRTGVLILTVPSATSVSGFLRRLVEDASPLARLFLVTDERVGLPLGPRGQDYLDDLRGAAARSFHAVELSFAEYVELDALQAAVRLARSGDLEIQPRPGQARPVTAEEVVESHHRRNRYLACRLLRELVVFPPPG
jgi:hypothetical protein